MTENLVNDVWAHFLTYHVDLKAEWLRAAVEFCQENGTPDVEMVQQVYYLWAHSDLQLTTASNFKAPTFACTQRVVLQVVSIVDVSISRRKQSKNADLQIQTSADPFPTYDMIKIPHKRMFRLELSDGERTVVAVEHQTIPALTNIRPGCKVLLRFNVRFQSGILLLTDANCQILGGVVAKFVDAAFEAETKNSLIRREVPTDPSPAAVPVFQPRAPIVQTRPPPSQAAEHRPSLPLAQPAPRLPPPRPSLPHSRASAPIVSKPAPSEVYTPPATCSTDVTTCFSSLLNVRKTRAKKSSLVKPKEEAEESNCKLSPARDFQLGDSHESPQMEIDDETFSYQSTSSSAQPAPSQPKRPRLSSPPKALPIPVQPPDSSLPKSESQLFADMIVPMLESLETVRRTTLFMEILKAITLARSGQ